MYRLHCGLKRNPSFRLVNVLCSDTLMFAHPRLKYTVRFNRVNLTKRNWILFKLSEFESTAVDCMPTF